MDIFIEQIVKKKRTAFDVVVVLALALGSTFINFILFNVSALFPAVGSIMFLVIALVFYLAYSLAMSRNLEYEYSMVNNEIDIDKIANQKKRKRLITLDVKKMEAFGKKSSQCERYLTDSSIKKIYACSDKDAEDVYYAVFFNDAVKTMLLFNPKQDIVNMIVKLNPRETYDV